MKTPPTLEEAGYEFKDGQLRLVNMQKALEVSGMLGSSLYPKDGNYPGSESKKPRREVTVYLNVYPDRVKVYNDPGSAQVAAMSDAEQIAVKHTFMVEI